MENENENDNENILNGSDFVFTQSIDDATGEATFVGGGYKVNSFFMKSGIPVLNQLGGLKKDLNNDNVSNPFENLAVPAGLFFIGQKKENANSMFPDTNYTLHTAIGDDIIDKLYGLVDADKKRQRKTKKHKLILTNKKKTRTNKK